MERYAPIANGFLAQLRRINGLDESQLRRLVFYPGMLFGSTEKWWGNGGKRTSSHEGLDICLYRTASGEVRQFGEQTRIPLMFDGEVKQIIDDYLGKSVFVSHRIRDSYRRRLYSIYGHIMLPENLQPGAKLSEGEVIGTVANAGKKVMPHVHISAAWLPEQIRIEELDWRIVADPVRVSLIDPLKVITCPYSIIEDNLGLPA